MQSVSRACVPKAYDNHHWPQHDLDLLHGESKREGGLETWQQYGFTSVVLPQDKQQGQQSQQGQSQSGMFSDYQSKGKCAETLVLFLANRSHGVALPPGDRRHRLRNMDEGETAFYDDQGQRIHIMREKMKLRVPDDKYIHHIVVKKKQQQSQLRRAEGGQQQQQGPTMGQDAKEEDEILTFIKQTKDTITIDAPTVLINASTKCVITSPKIAHVGTSYFGSEDASRPVSAQGTVDSDGDADTGNFLTKAFGI